MATITNPSTADVFAMAMEMEMEECSVFFYSQLLDLFPAQSDALKTLVEQEQHHLEVFRSLSV